MGKSLMIIVKKRQQKLETEEMKTFVGSVQLINIKMLLTLKSSPHSEKTMQNYGNVKIQTTCLRTHCTLFY